MTSVTLAQAFKHHGRCWLVAANQTFDRSAHSKVGVDVVGSLGRCSFIRRLETSKDGSCCFVLESSYWKLAIAAVTDQRKGQATRRRIASQSRPSEDRSDGESIIH